MQCDLRSGLAVACSLLLVSAPALAEDGPVTAACDNLVRVGEAVGHIPHDSRATCLATMGQAPAHCHNADEVLACMASLEASSRSQLAEALHACAERCERRDPDSTWLRAVEPAAEAQRACTNLVALAPDQFKDVDDCARSLLDVLTETCARPATTIACLAGASDTAAAEQCLHLCLAE